jgi:BMFP domain-containing protein YqiC
LESNEYKTVIDNMESSRLRDRAALQMRIKVLEQRNPDRTAVNKIRHLETSMEQREQAQGDFKARISALEDPRDPDQILEDVRERLADGIAQAVADSREEILQNIEGMIKEQLDQREPPPAPPLPPRPSRSPRRRSPRQNPYPPRQPTPPERRPLQEFYPPHPYYPGWPLPEVPQQPPQPRHPSLTPQSVPPIDP